MAEEAVAVVQLGHQLTALDRHLADFPLAAAVEQRQLALIPAPFLAEALQQVTLPAGTTLAGQAAEFLVHLQVQAAPHQLQPLTFATALQVLLDTPVDHHVRVELVEIEAIAEHRLLELQAQALYLRVFAGIDLGEQQLEHRLVGRLDALEQLPQPGADELARRDVREVAEVEVVFGAHEALGQQGIDVLPVACFFVDRYQPPQGRAPGEPDGGTVKLVEQQVMLGGAAVIGAELAVALALDEALRLDQKQVGFGALAGSPDFQQQAFLAQLCQFAFAEVGGVTDPDVHIALLGLGQGAQAAHQVQPVNRLGRVAAAGLVRERAGQALGFGQQWGIRLEIGDARRCVAGYITGQQWVIDVEKQRQQGQHLLLPARQPVHGPPQAPLVERQETLAQLAEHLAVNALVEVGANFVGVVHGELNRPSGEQWRV
ncbi:hypothetical protein D3C77_366170 [compost metagenome]